MRIMGIQNPMRRPKLGKVVVNISVGEPGQPLERASTILENLTGQTPSRRKAKRTIRAFGIRRGEPVACMVTLRGERARSFLERALEAIGKRIPLRSFDREGNLAFGIKEHIDIPGTRYDPTLGITGMDIIVQVERPGYRVERRRRGRSKVGRHQRMTREEAVEFIKSNFGTEVVP